MNTFNKEELLKIAQLSALTLEESEVVMFTQQITAILSYVEQLKTIPTQQQSSYVRNINVFRADTALKTDSSAIVAQGPETDENYFAVPKILDEK